MPSFLPPVRNARSPRGRPVVLRLDTEGRVWVSNEDSWVAVDTLPLHLLAASELRAAAELRRYYRLNHSETR